MTVSGGTESSRRARMRAGERLGWIYFIQEADNDLGPVKIGYCSTEMGITKRRKELQTGNPRRLEVVAAIRGTYESERQLHREFADDRGLGEWFHLSPALELYIERVAT